MSANQIDLKPTGNQLGNLLRHWRKIRGRNQFDLSFETGFSQRHISFIESGRSIPSRQTLLALAQALDVPLRERNTIAARSWLRTVLFRSRLEFDANAKRNQSA